VQVMSQPRVGEAAWLAASVLGIRGGAPGRVFVVSRSDLSGLSEETLVKLRKDIVLLLEQIAKD